MHRQNEKLKEMRTIKENIAEKVIDNLLTTCQYKSYFILNFASPKHENAKMRSETRKNQIEKITKVLQRWQRVRKIMPIFALGI